MSLSLFDVPDVDYRYEASREVEFQPALTGIQPITFSIPGSDDYYDLNSLRFKVKVRLTDPAAHPMHDWYRVRKGIKRGRR